MDSILIIMYVHLTLIPFELDLKDLINSILRKHAHHSLRKIKINERFQMHIVLHLHCIKVESVT